MGDESTLIAIENVAMFGGRIELRAAPNRERVPEGAHAHPAVVASLEEYADVWAELSKYLAVDDIV